MQIMVLGATGKTGLLAVEKALARGYQVVAYARNPQGLPTHSALTTIQGELHDTQKLTQAMASCQVVLCCLGTHQLKGVTLMQTQLPNIIHAMKSAHLERLVLLSAYGVGTSFQTAGCIAKIAYKTIVKDVYADKAVSEQFLSSSGLTWTSIYPVILMDGVLADSVEAVMLNQIHKIKGLPKVARANVAKVMLDSIMDSQTFGQQVVVCPAKNVVKMV